MHLTVSTSPKSLPVIFGLGLPFFGTRHGGIDFVDKFVKCIGLGYVRRNSYVVGGLVDRMVIDDLTYSKKEDAVFI